jgi:hypothetical protein
MSIFQPLDEPEKKSIGQLLELSKGDLGIPDFQREFVWGRTDVSELFESIFHGYYVGSLLFWANNKQLDMENKPIYGTGISQEKFNPRFVVLDGQQRVSSLYYAVKAPDVPLWNTKYPYLFFLDLKKLLLLLENPPEQELEEDRNLTFSLTRDQAKKQGLTERPLQFKTWHFPLFELEDFSDWLYDFSNYLRDEEGKSKGEVKEVTERVRKHLNYVLKEFQIPVIKLSENLELENVAKVFEKLNSMGVELTIFDLLNARLIKHGIRARRMWNLSRENCELLRLFSEGNAKFPIYVLQTIALIRKDKDVKKGPTSTKGKDLLRLDPANLETDWKYACDIIEEALKRIKLTRGEGFGVLTPKMLPYVTMIPVLAALLNKIQDRRDRPQCLTKIEHWYWGSVLTHAYSGSPETQLALDFREMTKWFDEDKDVASTITSGRHVISQPLDPESVPFLDIASTSDALYKGITCLIALRGGRDFVKTDIVDLSVLDDHHIFPVSRAKEFRAGPDIESILNKTLLHKDTNRDYIRNAKPSEYLSRIMNDQHLSKEEMIDRLRTHLISPDAYQSMQEDNFQKFIADRSKTIEAELATRVGLETSLIPQSRR